jgi:hypothetical protein
MTTKDRSSSIAHFDGLIHEMRGQKVMLGDDLARIYGVETRALNQAVKRNREQFPSDFMFRLTSAEAEEVRRSRSQRVILKRGTISNTSRMRLPSTEPSWPPMY